MLAQRPALVVAALWMVNFASSVQVLIVAPILPRIHEQLGVPEALLGTLVTAYAVSLSVFALLAGPVSDRFGRRFILVAGSAVLTLALFAHALADSYVTLLVARAFAGVGGGALSGASVAYVGDAFPYHRRGWANGWVASGFAAGQIFGIPLGALLAETDFRVPFVAFGVMMTIALTLLVRFVPQPPVERSGALTLGSALAGYARLLRRPATAASVATYTFMFFGIALFVTYLPTWLEETFHVSGRAVASLFLVGGLANLVTGPQAGSLSDRIGRKGLIVGSGVTIGLIMAATTWTIYAFWVAYVQFFVVMVFVALRLSPQQSLISSIVPSTERGALISLAMAVGQVGFAAGATLSGVLYVGVGYTTATLVAGLSSIAAAACIAFFVPEPGDGPIGEPARAIVRDSE